MPWYKAMRPFLVRRFAAVDCGPPTVPHCKFSVPFRVEKNPHFQRDRLHRFEELWERRQLAPRAKSPIRIVLPDGSEKPGTAWSTTPMDIAKAISPRLAKESVVARVKPLLASSQSVVAVEDTPHREFLWDLTRELEGDCELQLLPFSHSEAKEVFWHSSAHLLGACLEALYGALLGMGPALDSGFYYDAFLGEESLSQDHFAEIEKVAAELVARKLPFQRLVLTKEQALQLFAHNPFKAHLIQHKIPDGQSTSVYRCGDLVDLCRGPHLPSTGAIKAFALTKNSSCYWLGSAQNNSLQRVYGISFPDKKQLEEYQETQKKLAEHDHHNIGRSQELYFWHTSSPGSTFFLPAGTRVYNRLVSFLQREYRFRGFQEVLTPNMFNCDLWKTSGHYQKYREDMFLLGIEGQEWALKPMNCPGHCLMFAHTQRSYKDLPIRYADFGVLHRNEASGALGGLTRVRRFQQDDGHIFCRKDQISSEVLSSLDFLSYVYATLGFEYELELSTRPANALGSEDLWKAAEEQLAAALSAFGKPWKVNPGDGAFYGPKIDIKVYDAMKRRHQCGTIQLDFNLPKRFNLQYKAEEGESSTAEPLAEYEDCKERPCRPGFERPVIIHRAILGSIERMMAVLAEQYAGKWPFWLSPRQVVVIPISEKFHSYADRVGTALGLCDFYVDVDKSSLTLNKKIRNAQLSQYNYICVVGSDEEASATVDVRDRKENRSIGKFSLPSLISVLRSQSPSASPAELRVRSASEVLEVRYSVHLRDLERRLEDAQFLAGDKAGEEDWRVWRAMGRAPDPHTRLHAWYERLQALSVA